MRGMFMKWYIEPINAPPGKELRHHPAASSARVRRSEPRQPHRKVLVHQMRVLSDGILEMRQRVAVVEVEHAKLDDTNNRLSK